jgi:hypothetical protein
MTDTSKEARAVLQFLRGALPDADGYWFGERGEHHTGSFWWRAKLSIFDTLIAERDALRAAQSYTYIGKDGKPILARDLEDERDALRAENQRLRATSIDF